MRTILLPGSILLLAGMLAPSGSAAAATNRPGMFEFMAAQHDREWTGTPREVLAFYYNWYGRPERHGDWIHWGGEDKSARDIPESRHYPARGAYDSQDPQLVAAHIREARNHGVSGFIATWWGQGTFEDEAFRLLLDQAETNNFKATVYWEKAPGQGDEQVAGAIDDLVYVLKNYGSRRAFLKVQGKPVIFVYGRTLEQVPPASWPVIITRARERAGDFLLMADGYSESHARLFDGVHTYNICGEVRGKSPEALRAWSREHYAAAVHLARRHGRISCVTVIPGYDDTKIRQPGLKADRQDGETYRVLWEEAMRAQPDWVLITSWNEWHEGSEIEPSWEDGDKYLKLTAEYAQKFLAGKKTGATVAPKSTALSGPRREWAKSFRGRTIGLLPDFGDVAFWLVDAGLSVRELSWADVANPAVLSPKSFPVLLHAGGESYSGMGKVSGDILPALQRYLAGGGFLVSIPNQPFPFYYDSTTGGPRVIANQVGLPVEQGWEQPPGGVKLEFHFDTKNLPSLPATAPFPGAGDLRWRPATRQALQPGDVYLPLASLVDSKGRVLGDGMAYVELHQPPVAGGRTLYVWMRMGDTVGAENLLNAVFQFIGERL